MGERGGDHITNRQEELSLILGSNDVPQKTQRFQQNGLDVPYWKMKEQMLFVTRSIDKNVSLLLWWIILLDKNAVVFLNCEKSSMVLLLRGMNELRKTPLLLYSYYFGEKNQSNERKTFRFAEKSGGRLLSCCFCSFRHFLHFFPLPPFFFLNLIQNFLIPFCLSILFSCFSIMCDCESEQMKKRAR